MWTELAIENFETVLSSLEMRLELSLVSSWPSFQFATWLPTVTSYLETGSRLVHKCVHAADKTRQNCSVSNILRTTENCLRLPSTQFTPTTRQDKTRQDSLVLLVSAVWTRHYKTISHAQCDRNVNTITTVNMINIINIAVTVNNQHRRTSRTPNCHTLRKFSALSRCFDVEGRAEWVPSLSHALNLHVHSARFIRFTSVLVTVLGFASIT